MTAPGVIDEAGSAAASESPAERHSTLVDGVSVLGSLSPSRAADFISCPLLFRFRTIDRLPESPSPDAMRGTVIHKVLEDLFDLAAADRTPETAATMVGPAWEAMLSERPEMAEMFDDEGDETVQWLASCQRVLKRYFDLEDPRRLEPAERELYVETLTEAKLLLRGFIDRVDVAPDGRIRIVDYKTGRAPSIGFEASSLFQMKFYALVVWRTRGVMPSLLQLIYLGSGETLSYVPDERDLLATERKVEAIWQAIESARESAEWPASKGPLCNWCSYKALCPQFGGTPPPLPVVETETDDQAVAASAAATSSAVTT